MTRFTFVTDEESEAFFGEIVRELVRLFSISEEEAVGRVNRQWAGRSVTGHYNLIYHESPEYFAKTVYYGPGVLWWKGEAGLRGTPYP